MQGLIISALWIVISSLGLLAEGEKHDAFFSKANSALEQKEANLHESLGDLRAENPALFDEWATQKIKGAIYQAVENGNGELRYAGLSQPSIKRLFTFMIRNGYRTSAMAQISRNILNLDKDGGLAEGDQGDWVYKEILKLTIMESEGIVRGVLFSLSAPKRLELYEKLLRGARANDNGNEHIANYLRLILRKEDDSDCLAFLSEAYEAMGLDFDKERANSVDDYARMSVNEAEFDAATLASKAGYEDVNLSPKHNDVDLSLRDECREAAAARLRGDVDEGPQGKKFTISLSLITFLLGAVGLVALAASIVIMLKRKRAMPHV